ncbi:MAG: response regulator [Acidobacteriota bacterium]|nr:response regulator [Acidobacteriota bacterium]
MLGDSQRRYEILVIEDNPADVCLIREAFQECGHHCNVTFVSTKQEAREILNARQFDLVITDFGADCTESVTFIQAIRSISRLRPIPIVVLSGSHNPNPAYEAGANAFIEKSSDVDIFFEKIRNVMGFWTRVAQLPSPPRSHSARSIRD